MRVSKRTGAVDRPQLITTRVDSRGRITLPKDIREALDIREGDTCFISLEENYIQVIRGENPFKVLAEDALKQHREGKTVSFEEALAPLFLSDETTSESPPETHMTPSPSDSSAARRMVLELIAEEFENTKERLSLALDLLENREASEE
jgi:antitoxin PrlF